jgi:acyl dehydratase
LRTLYYEDIEPGATFRTEGRTITEADSTFFSMLTGDWNPLHCNAPAAQASRFGQRVVAGMFGMTLINGALHQWAIFEKSGLTMLGIRDWRFLLPIHIGDTLMVEMQVDSKRITSRQDAGLLERKFTIRNQHGETVQSGYSDMLITLRPDTEVKRESHSSENKA